MENAGLFKKFLLRRMCKTIILRRLENISALHPPSQRQMTSEGAYPTRKASEVKATFTATDTLSKRPFLVQCALSRLSIWIHEGEEATLPMFERATRAALLLKLDAVVVGGALRYIRTAGTAE